MKPPLMTIDLSTTEGGTGHVGFVFHKQPSLEKAIRDAVAQNPLSELRSSSTLTSISEDAENVYIKYSEQSGTTKRIKARFVVGADGKTGFVRKKYLEPQGITLDRCEG